MGEIEVWPIRISVRGSLCGNPFFEGSFPWSLSGDACVGFALYLWWIWSLSGVRFSVADVMDGSFSWSLSGGVHGGFTL